MDQEIIQKKNLSLMEELQADLRKEDMKIGFNSAAFEQGQERTKKGKSLSHKIKGLRVLADKIKSRGTVVSIDMLSENMINAYEKKYGLSKKDMKRMVNEMQNGDYAEMQEETTEVLTYDAVDVIDADVEALDFAEIKRSKVSKKQDMSEQHLELCQELGGLLLAKRTELGVNMNSMRMINLAETDIREFKRYGLSKKELEKLSKDIQTGTLKVDSYTPTSQVAEDVQEEVEEVHEVVEDVHEEVEDIHEVVKDVQEEVEDIQEVVEDVQEEVEDIQEVVQEEIKEETQELQKETVEKYEEVLKTEEETKDSSVSEDLEEAEKKKLIKRINRLFKDYIKQPEITDDIEASESYEKLIAETEKFKEVYKEVKKQVAEYLNYIKYYIYSDLSIKKYGYVLEEDNDDSTELLNEFNDLYSEYRKNAKDLYNKAGLTAFETEEGLENVFARCYSMKIETEARIKTLKSKLDSLKSMWEEQQREEEAKRKKALKERRNTTDTINEMFEEYKENLDFEYDIEASEDYDEMIGEMRSFRELYENYRKELRKYLKKIKNYVIEELSITNYGGIIKNGEEGYEDLIDIYGELCSKIDDIYKEKGLSGFETKEELKDVFARCYAMDIETTKRINKLKSLCVTLEKKKEIAQNNAQQEQSMKQQQEKKETTVIKITKETVAENPEVERHMLDNYKEYINSLRVVWKRKNYLQSLIRKNDKLKKEYTETQERYFAIRKELPTNKQSEWDELLNEYMNEVKNILQNGAEIGESKFENEDEREIIYQYASDKAKYEFSNSIMSVVNSELETLSKRMNEFIVAAKEYRDILKSNPATYKLADENLYERTANTYIVDRIGYLNSISKFDNEIKCDNILANVVDEMKMLVETFKDIKQMQDSINETEKIHDEGAVDLAAQVSENALQEAKQKIQESEETKQKSQLQERNIQDEEQEAQLQEEISVNEKLQQEAADEQKVNLQEIRNDISKLAEAWNKVEDKGYRRHAKSIRNEYIDTVITGLLNNEIVSEKEIEQYIKQYAVENKKTFKKMCNTLRSCIITGTELYGENGTYDEQLIYHFEKQMELLGFKYESVAFMRNLLKAHNIKQFD